MVYAIGVKIGGYYHKGAPGVCPVRRGSEVFGGKIWWFGGK